MKYTPLHQTPSMLRWPILVHGFSALPSGLTIIATVCFVFLAGKYVHNDREAQYEHRAVISDPISLDTYTKVFHYNYSFVSSSSDESTEAWKSIFPLQGGYFRHPEISKQRAAFAVFHQLHCLNGIWEGNRMLYQAVTQGRKLREEDLPFMASAVHLRHCVDLLRQSLQCQPDLTVEIKNDELNGVTGFGTAHRCLNWDQLLAWLKDWESWTPL